MMSNDEMREGRFLRWHRARRAEATIKGHLASGGTITISTHTRHTRLTQKHSNMIVAFRNGLYMQRGKAWDFIGCCKIILH